MLGPSSRPGPQVPDDERPCGRSRRTWKRPAPRPGVAHRHPARPRRDDRDPLRRRRRRGLGPAPAPQGRRGVRASWSSPSRRSSRDGRAHLRRPRSADWTSARRIRRRPWPPVTRSSAAGAVPDAAVREAARAILADVRVRGARRRARGVNARSAAAALTGACCWTADELRAAADASSPPNGRPRTAIANVRRFAEAQRPRVRADHGRPRRRASSAGGCPSSASARYVPGGSAPYPSSLVMTVVPARVAGVGAVVVA